MKVGINDGCANGGMMDKLEEGDEWFPMVVVEVTEEEWSLWEKFLELNAHWERLWDNKMRAGEKAKRG